MIGRMSRRAPSVLLSAEERTVSEATVRRIWLQRNLQPHRVETFKLSRDEVRGETRGHCRTLPEPPGQSAGAVRGRENQIQALDRAQPGLPLKPGRCGTVPHDYKRHGMTTLFPALSTLDGKVIGDCMPRHRHQEVPFFYVVGSSCWRAPYCTPECSL
jgi:hypothetical protein